MPQNWITLKFLGKIEKLTEACFSVDFLWNMLQLIFQICPKFSRYICVYMNFVHLCKDCLLDITAIVSWNDIVWVCTKDVATMPVWVNLVTWCLRHGSAVWIVLGHALTILGWVGFSHTSPSTLKSNLINYYHTFSALLIGRHSRVWLSPESFQSS